VSIVELTLAAGLSGFVGWLYVVAFGFLPLLGVTIAHAAATSSLAPLSDALAVAAASNGRGFPYGWVRGAGSGAFVFGTLLSGQLVDRFGLSCIIVTSRGLFCHRTFRGASQQPAGGHQPSGRGWGRI
jgi:PPP family 3-phenylpropionic acid transporter